MPRSCPNRAAAEAKPRPLVLAVADSIQVDCAASFDRGVGLSHDTGAITHNIGPDIDAERNFLIGDLSAAGLLASTSEIPGIGATKGGRNGGGDSYFTDGLAVIGVLKTLP